MEFWKIFCLTFWATLNIFLHIGSWIIIYQGYSVYSDYSVLIECPCDCLLKEINQTEQDVVYGNCFKVPCEYRYVKCEWNGSCVEHIMGWKESSCDNIIEQAQRSSVVIFSFFSSLGFFGVYMSILFFYLIYKEI